jgi:hypothetical protein
MNGKTSNRNALILRVLLCVVMWVVCICSVMSSIRVFRSAGRLQALAASDPAPGEVSRTFAGDAQRLRRSATLLAVSSLIVGITAAAITRKVYRYHFRGIKGNWT